MMNRMRWGLALAVPALVAAASIADSPVADAAMKGDIAAVRALIAKGADVSAPRGDGMTALHWAAERGDSGLAATLIRAKASVKATTRVGGYTPLHLAARGGHNEIVIALLKAGADPNSQTASGATAAHLAAGSGASDALNALADKGVDLNLREREWGQTPLIFAAAGNRSEAVRILIKRGVDVNAKSRMINIQEETAKDQAAARRRNEVLLGFDSARTRDSLRALAGGADVPMRAVGGYTLRELGFAALVGDTAVPGAGGRGAQGPQPKGPFTPAQMQAAIAAGRQVLQNQSSGRGPVVEVVDTINGGVAGFGNQVGGVGGLTALHHAVRQGNLSSVRALLDGGADVNMPNDVDNTTPLLQATINGNFDVAMELIKRGANPNIASRTGLAPLYATINTRWAPKSRYPQPQAVQIQKTTHLELMEALLTAGANPNLRLAQQFWYFAYNNCGNANCGLENLEGSSPFWRATYSLDVDAMRLLVKHGADPKVPSQRNPAAAGRGGRAGGRGGPPGADSATLAAFARGGGGGGGAGGPGGANARRLDPAIDSASRAVPAGIGVYPVHAAAGVGYGNGFAGNAHIHAAGGWMPTLKYLVEELGADVNARDAGGYTPMHHAAARGDNEMILYLVSKGADPKAVARNGMTTLDMANGPVSRISPIPETMKLLESLGAINTHRCASC